MKNSSTLPQIRRAAMDASLGKPTILNHSEWIKNHKDELSPATTAQVFRALARIAPENAGTAATLANCLLEGARFPLTLSTTPWAERAWLLESLGDLVQAGATDSDNLSGLGRRKVKRILNDTMRFIQENGPSMAMDLLLAAGRKATLTNLAHGKSGRRPKTTTRPRSI